MELAEKDPVLADDWSWVSATEPISCKIAEYMDEDGDRIADRGKKLEENQELAEGTSGTRKLDGAL